MQKIFFHKTVDLDSKIKELISISVDESIQYKLEQDGMRAIGSIVIHGEYDDGMSKKKFKEDIDLDISASNDKIIDKHDFLVKVEDFDYSINDGILSLVIQTNVYGVQDDEDKHIYVDEPIIEELFRQEDEIVKENIEIPIKEDIVKENIVNEEINEDDEDEDIGAYYFYVVSDGDSYSSIADKYSISETELRAYNHDRDISAGIVVIIPYLPC